MLQKHSFTNMREGIVRVGAKEGKEREEGVLTVLQSKAWDQSYRGKLRLWSFWKDSSACSAGLL